MDTPNPFTTEEIDISNTRVRREKWVSSRVSRAFVGLHDNTRPVLDANGTRDASGSRPTKKIVTYNHGTLSLHVVSPRPDEDISLDDYIPSRAEALDDAGF